MRLWTPSPCPFGCKRVEFTNRESVCGFSSTPGEFKAWLHLIDPVRSVYWTSKGGVERVYFLKDRLRLEGSWFMFSDVGRPYLEDEVVGTEAFWNRVITEIASMEPEENKPPKIDLSRRGRLRK